MTLTERKRPGESFWWYGKRRYVPDSCPSCGRDGAWKYTYRLVHGFYWRKPPLLGWGLGGQPYFNQILSEYMSAYTRSIAVHPMWRMPRWYGKCGDCAFHAALYSPISFLTKDKDTTWQGGVFYVPFLGKATGIVG